MTDTPFFHCSGCHSDVLDMNAHRRNCFAFSMKNGCEALKFAKWRREPPDGAGGGGGDVAAVDEPSGVEVDGEAAVGDVEDDGDVVDDDVDEDVVAGREEA